jgi:hypothetical protein
MRVERVAAIVTLTCSLASCNAVLGPTTPDSHWSVHESAHFSLHARPGSFGERSAPTLGTVLDDQYETTLRLLQGQYAGRVSGFLYNDAADAGFESEHSGTAYSQTGAFRATATPPLDANLYSLVQHEANHVVITGAIGRAATSMVSEGLASALISERYGSYGPRFYYTWTRNHKSQLIPIERLADDDEWPDLPSDLAYSFSASFLAWLLETEGPVKLRQLYYASSSEFAARFSQIYGRSVTDAQAAWLAFCDGFSG